jgi:hypothetical protein
VLTAEVAFVHVVDIADFLIHFKALLKRSDKEVLSKNSLVSVRVIVSVIVMVSSSNFVIVLVIASLEVMESMNDLTTPLLRISDKEEESENPRLIPLLIVSVTDMVSSATPSQTRDTTRLLSKSITSFKDKSITGARKKFIV